MSSRSFRLIVAVLFVLALHTLGGGRATASEDLASLPDVANALNRKQRDIGPLGNGSWVGDVFVLPYTHEGSYEPRVNGELNVEPRKWVAQSFLAANADSYDFLLVLTQFEFSSEDGLAGFYWSVRNDVHGIGLPIMDLAGMFGSERLQGLIDGGNLAQYLDEDGALDVDKVAVVLNHEIGHRWLAYCRFLDESGNPSEALLGRDGVHWSYLLDSDASFLYGSDWQANGDGTFTATEVLARYSPLDLYLMGLLPPEEMPPFQLLENDTADPEGLPHLGDTIEASVSQVTVDQVIAAEGPREPAAADAPKSFNVAVIYLVDPDSTVNQEELDAAQAVVATWRRAFFRHTQGQALVDTGRTAQPPTSSQDVDLGAAVAWLEDAGENGIWSDAPSTTVRDTAEAVMALSQFPGAAATVDVGVDELAALEPGSAELLARQAAALVRWGRSEAAAALAETLAARAEEDGGWPAFGRYSPDAVTTARAVAALHAAGTASELQERGWTWLLEGQNPDGGWGWRPGGPSAVYPTEEVLLAAVRTRPGAAQEPWVGEALAWLLGRAEDGGLGEPWPDVLQTSLFLQLAGPLGVDRATVDAAIAFLGARQGEDGSWQQSIAATAAAVTALAPYFMPDPAVYSAELIVTPERVFEGDSLQLQAAVRNLGAELPQGYPYRWELVDAVDPGRVWADLPGVLPGIPAGGWVALNDTWAPAVPAGNYLLRLVLDPEGVADDGDRANNQAQTALDIAAHTAGVDLVVSASSLSAAPESVETVPQALVLSLELENLGLSPANGARIAVFDAGRPGNTELGSVTVDCAALGEVPVQIPLTLAEPRAYSLAVVADPDDVLHDEDRTSNRASLLVPMEPTWDPMVVAGSFHADPADVTAGQPVTLQATIRNGGTRELDSLQIAFSYRAGPPPESVPIAQVELTDPIAAGESRTVSTQWRPGVLDSPVTLGIEVDPNGAVDDHDRGNNTATAHLTVAPGTLPDLVARPEAISFDPEPADQGATVTISAEVSNDGTVPASAFQARVRLDDPGTGPVVAETTVDSLDPGSTVVLSGSWTVNGPADRVVYLIADGADAVGELNEDNNRAFRVLPVRSLADLVLTSAGITADPGYPHGGEAVQLMVTVDNLGEQPTPQTTVEMRGEDGSLVGSTELPALAPGGRGTVVLTWSAPEDPQDVSLTFEVNPGHAFAEQDYGNNRAVITLAVQDADFYLTEHYISPNGDGVQDSVGVFFRNPLPRLSVRTPEGALVREIAVPEGAASVVWNGTDDQGRIVRDGIYVLRGGEAEATVVVDTNRLSLLASASGVLVGQSVRPSPGGELDFGFDPAASPAGAGLFFLDRPDTGPAHLLRFAWGNFSEIGDWPDGVDAPDSASSRGEVLLSVDWYDSVTLVHLPEGTAETRPWRSGFTSPSLSPDGRWIVWGAEDGTELLFESVADPSLTRTFGPFGQPGDGCGIWGSLLVPRRRPRGRGTPPLGPRDAPLLSARPVRQPRGP